MLIFYSILLIIRFSIIFATNNNPNNKSMKKRVKGCTLGVLNAVEAVSLWLAAGCSVALAVCNAVRGGLVVATAKMRRGGDE